MRAVVEDNSRLVFGKYEQKQLRNIGEHFSFEFLTIDSKSFGKK